MRQGRAFTSFQTNVHRNHKLLTFHFKFVILCYYKGGWDRGVSIATRYGMEGPGIESRWERGFSGSFQTCLGAHLASHTMGNGFLS
jgi:hypothetical protein